MKQFNFKIYLIGVFAVVFSSLFSCSSDDDVVTPEPTEPTVNAPVAQPNSYTTPANQSITIDDLTANDSIYEYAYIRDIDNESEEGGTIENHRDGSYTYTPPEDFTGEDTFEYNLCDASTPMNCSTATVTMRVLEGDPVAEDIEYVFQQNNTAIELEDFTDNDELVGNPVVTEISYNGSGSAVLNEYGTITYTPSTDFIGEETIEYTLCNSNEEPTCATAIITLRFFEEYSLSVPNNLSDYYGDIIFSSDQEANYTLLSELTEEKHSNQLSYGQRHDYLYNADADLQNQDNVVLVYSSESRYWEEYLSGNNNYDTQTFNTEHVYPQSLFDREATIRGDLHHLRTADVDINANRGNYPFAEGSGSYQLINGNSWYPGDEWKGDVARMILYLNLRYDLNVDLVGNMDLFLKWNREDPVSDFEKQRNNVIEAAQGNRNPFIDNPYLATLIWGGEDADNTWE